MWLARMYIAHTQKHKTHARTYNTRARARTHAHTHTQTLTQHHMHIRTITFHYSCWPRTVLPAQRWYAFGEAHTRSPLGPMMASISPFSALPETSQRIRLSCMSTVTPSKLSVGKVPAMRPETSRKAQHVLWHYVLCSPSTLDRSLVYIRGCGLRLDGATLRPPLY